MFNHYKIHFRLLSHNVKLFLLGHAILGFGYSIYTLLLNLYLSEAGFKEGFMGNLASTTSLGMALIAFPAALVLERFHVKPLVKLGVAIVSVSYFLQMMTNKMELLSLFGLLGGMGLALFNISVSPFIYRNSTGITRFTLYSLNACVLMISHFIGYLIAGRLPQFMREIFSDLNRADSFQYSIFIGLVIMSSSFLIFSRLEKRPIPRVKRSFLDGIKDKNWKIISKLILPKASIAFGAGLIIPFMNIYLKEKLTLSTVEIGWVFAVLQVFIFGAVFISPFLTKKMNNLSLIIFTCILSVPFMLMISYSGSLSLVLMSFFIRGMLMNMSGPITNMFEMEHVKEQDCIFVSAMLVFSYNMSWTLSTQLGGYLIENYSFKYSFFAAAFFYALAGAFYYMFFKNEKKTPLSTVSDTPSQLAA